MGFLFFLLGLCTGWLLTYLSDYLPRFSASRPTLLPLHARKGLAVTLLPRLRQNPRAFINQHGLHAACELISAGTFVWLWGQFGLSWELLFHVFSYIFFMLIALIDIKYRLVLDVITYPAIILVVLFQLVLEPDATLTVFVGGVMTFVLFFLTAALKPGDLGGGDIKLAALLGFAFGFPAVLWALIVGAGGGALVAVYLLLRHPKKKIFIPYAPFLCFGAMVALFFNPFAELV